MSTGESKQVRIDSLHPAKFHHRTNWGDMNAMASSIAAHGVIVPLVARERKEGGYEIVAGVRRWRGGKQAGLKTIPVYVRDLTDDEAIIAQAEENFQRTDIHPMDTAEYFGEPVSRGHEPGAVGKIFGVKKRDVVRRLKLLSLTKKARDAFIKGTIDEEAALAIARVELPARQTDIIAAIDAGHIQNEEVPGYVQRTFTATLEDVPWRVTDAGLVPKAGPCTTCPKRSTVQRELFAEQVTGDRCMDIDCYRSKMEACWALVVARTTNNETAINAEIHTVEAPLLFVPSAGGRPVLMKSSGMVDAEAPCPYLIGHTWREAIAKAVPTTSERPTEYRARDQDGRPRQMFREAVAQKIVRKSEVGKAAEAIADAADPTRPDNSAAKAEAKIRKALIEQLSIQVVENTEADPTAWITDRIIESATARSVAAAVSQFAEAIAEVGGEGKTGLLMLVAKSNRRARQVALAVMIRDEADVVGDLSPAIRELAKLYDLDLPAIENALRDR